VLESGLAHELVDKEDLASVFGLVSFLRGTACVSSSAKQRQVLALSTCLGAHDVQFVFARISEAVQGVHGATHAS